MKILPIAIVIPYRFSGEELQIWLQRRESADALNGLLEFPGGKIEASETPAQAAIREVHEESGVSLNSDQVNLFKIYTHKYPDKTVSIYAFIAKCDEETFPSSGWMRLGEDCSTVYSGKIPDANHQILHDILLNLKA